MRWKQLYDPVQTPVQGAKISARQVPAALNLRNGIFFTESFTRQLSHADFS